MPLANDLRSIQQQGGTRLHRGPAPCLECIEGSSHRFFGVLGASLLVDAHHLRRPRRVAGLDFAVGSQAMAANDEVVFVAQVAGHQVQCGLHLAGVFRVLEVGKRLITELALGRARLNFSRKCHGCHSESIVAPRADFSFHILGCPVGAWGFRPTRKAHGIRGALDYARKLQRSAQVFREPILRREECHPAFPAPRL